MRRPARAWPCLAGVLFAAGARAVDLSLTSSERQNVLAVMNAARADRGACPLTWDDTLQAETLTRTGNGDDANCPVYCLPNMAPCDAADLGEYVYTPIYQYDASADAATDSGSDVLLRTVNFWADTNTGEAALYETDTNLDSSAHYQKVVNKKATKVACSVCLGSRQSEWGTDQWHFLLCVYDDSKGQAVSPANIGTKGDTCDFCDSVTCAAPPSNCHEEQGTCVKTTGECEYAQKADNTPCDDGDAATVMDSCNSGTCVGYDLCAGVTCVAPSPCHDPGVCDPASGLCTSTPWETLLSGGISGRRADTLVAPPNNDIACDDGDASTTDDVCECSTEDRNGATWMVCTGKCSGKNQCAPDRHPGCAPPQCKVCDNCCDGTTGACNYGNAAADTTCNDGRSDTREDKCDGQGNCVGTDVCLGKTGEQIQCPTQSVGSLSCQFEGVCDPENQDSHGIARCKYTYKDVGASCNDGDDSTTHDVCVADGAGKTTCQGQSPCDYPVAVVCEPLDECHFAGTCDPKTGKCSNPPKDGTFGDNSGGSTVTLCDDEDPDTVLDQCQWISGVFTCKGIDLCEGVVCQKAKSFCFEDSYCDQADGVCKERRKLENTPCDDGDALTVFDQCTYSGTDAVCQGTDKCAGQGPNGARKTCPADPADPQLACVTQGWCESATGDCNYAKAEYNKPADDPCNDGDDGTVNDKCVIGTDGVAKCRGEEPCKSELVEVNGVRVCPWDPWGQAGALQMCNEAFCNPATNKCDLRTYSRQSGVSCDDNEPKTVEDMCSPVTKTLTVNGQSLTLEVGECAGEDKCGQLETPPRQCAVKNSCYSPGTCEANTGLCTYTAKAVGDACDDGNERTQGDACAQVGQTQELVCVGTDLCAGKVCTAQSQCHVAGSCDIKTGVCSNPTAKQGTPCDDANDKTVYDFCDGQTGTCAGIDLCQGVTCNARSQCHDAGVCDQQTGACSEPLKAANAVCDDGESRTVNDKCDGQGKCVGVNLCLDPTTGKNKDCPPVSECFGPGQCDYQTGKCSEPPVAQGTACDDSDMTTKSDVCDGQGACKGVPKCGGVTCGVAAGAQCHVAGDCEATTGLCTCVSGAWTQSGCPNPGATCDDGVAETVVDTCKYDSQRMFVCAGVNLCEGVVCRANGQCKLAGVCDHATGLCSSPDKKQGQPCDDGLANTAVDFCDGKGKCIGIDLCEGVQCPAMSDCHEPGACNPDTGLCSTPKKASGTVCDDGDITTVNDKCIDGKCTGEEKCGGQQCTSTKQCYIAFCDVRRGDNGQPDVNECAEKPGMMDVPCDDGDDTTKDDKCTLISDGSAAACEGTPKCAGVNCPALSGCHEAGTCNPKTGKCVPNYKASASDCDDSDDRTVLDKCDGQGNCVGVNLCEGVSCTSTNQCNQDGICQHDTGLCKYAPKKQGSECDDGDDDTVYDHCDGKSTCVGINLCEGVTCVLRNSCDESGYCNHTDGSCRYRRKAEKSSCDDGDATTVLDRCTKEGRCVGVNLCAGVVCPVEECRGVSVCDYATGLCSAPKLPLDTQCNDGDDATVEDKCDADGKCVGVNKCLDAGGQPKVCLAVDDCHEAGECDKFTGRCSTPNKVDGTTCDDGNDRTVEDKCTSGKCQGEDKCANVPVAQCTTEWVAGGAGGCRKQGVCDITTGQCTNPFVADGTQCDDGSSATVKDICHAGECKGYDPCLGVTCKPINSCHQQETCVPNQQTFQADCKVTPKAADSVCDDGLDHTVDDKCKTVGQQFLCAGVLPCNGGCPASSNPCKVNECKISAQNPAGLCVERNLADGLACDDGDANTVLDSCKAGTCRGYNLCAGVTCTALNQCYDVGVCEPLTGLCTNPAKVENTPCDDGEKWTANDVCKQGRCKGTDKCKSRSVDAQGNACGFKNSCYSRGVCQPATGTCDDGTPMAADKSCSDGNPATVGDVCKSAASGNGMECVGVDPCIGFDCKPAGQCFEAGQCEVDPITKHPRCTIVKKPKGTDCDDGVATTVRDRCRSDGSCRGEDLCANAPPCVLPQYAHPACNTPGQCDYSTGKCTPHTVNAAGVAGECDDGNDRTVEDKCVSAKRGFWNTVTVGVCQGTDKCKNVKCKGATQCQKNAVCDPATGNCIEGEFLAKDTPCDDGDLTTKDDVCAGGSDTCKGVDVCLSVTCPAPTEQCKLQGKCEPRRFKIPGGGYGFSSSANQKDALLTYVDKDGNVKKSKIAFDSAAVSADFNVTGGDDSGLCTTPAKPDLVDCDDNDDTTVSDQCIKGNCRGVSCSIQAVVETFGAGSCVWNSRGEGGGYGWSPDGNLYVDGNCGGTFLFVATGEMVDCPADGQYKECRRPMLLSGAKADIRDVWSIIKKQCVPAPEVPGCAKDKCWIDHGKGCCVDGQKRVFTSYTKGSKVALSECLALAEDYKDSVIGLEWIKDQNKCKLLVPPGTTLADPAGGWDETDTSAAGEAPVDGKDGQSCPDVQCLSPRDRCIRVECKRKDECHRKGQCESHSGKCTNPYELQGSTCDDGDSATTNDICDGHGECTGEEPPGCFVQWQRHPAQTCRQDRSRCSDVWGQQVWGTMEECCRPGNAHLTGCAAGPPDVPDECWRADSWFPTRECKMDKEACSWGNWGEGVFKTKAECCAPGGAFDCGCSKPPGPPRKCFVKSTNSYDTNGNWKRECVDVGEQDQSLCDSQTGKVYNSRDECCNKEWAPYGCTLPCKALDVVIVLDGSGSMQARFSGHSHGFYATIEMLNDWVGRLPLTGEKAGRGLATLPNGGVRVGLVQFSGSNPRGRYNKGYSEAKVAPWSYRGSKGTGGKLSGDKNELLTDVKWHRYNFMRRGTMIRKGLEMAANMFEDATPNRQRAVILITDGRIYDEKELMPVRRTLDKKKAVVFGVVVRKTRYHTSTDATAERILKPVLSGVVDEHFYNIEIDDIPSKVLNGMCDPNSPWGAYMKPDVQAVAAKLPADVAKTATGQGQIWDRLRRMKPFADADCSAIDAAAKADSSKCGCDTALAGAIVMIEDGYDKRDKLSCAKCRSLGVVAEWKSSVGMLYLRGRNKKLSDFVNALQQVEFYTTSSDKNKRKFTYNFGEGWGTSTSQGHFYQYFAKRAISWDAAQRSCESKTLLGMQGYLMTVTTPGEQKLAMEKLAGQGWMGASDAGQEGKWRWVTGPEGCAGEVGGSCAAGDGLGTAGWVRNRGNTIGTKHRTGGTFFYDQNTKAASSECKDLTNGKCFTNWDRGEPNEWHRSCPGDCRCCGEDFAHFWWPRGTWNDYPLHHNNIQGYICEWGGIGTPCLDTPLDSREYVHSTMWKPPPVTPPVQDPCLLPVEKPDPLPAGGCITGWVLTPAGSEAGWKEEDCPKKCLNQGGSQLTLECRDTSGTFQKCSCPRVATAAQCHCGNWNNGASETNTEYCASKERDNSVNGKQCFSTVEPEFTIRGEAGWDADETYFGVPPASQGDGDASFQCQTYDRNTRTWSATLMDGQCQDSNKEYFSRYSTAVYTDSAQQACKKLCGSRGRPECHSIHWGEAITDEEKEMCKARTRPDDACSICTLNVLPPESKCAPGQILCRKPKAVPTAGSKCGCSKYTGNADARQTQFCTKQMNWGPDMKLCKPLNGNGQCPTGWELCGGSTAVQLTCKPGKCNNLPAISVAVTKPLNIPGSWFTVHSVCTSTVCKNGKCKTITDKKANGCAVREYKCGNDWNVLPCGEYRNGAKRGDLKVCRKNKKERGIYKCMRPNPGDGKCPGDHTLCTSELRFPGVTSRHAEALANEEVVVDVALCSEEHGNSEDCPRRTTRLQSATDKAAKGAPVMRRGPPGTTSRRAHAQADEDDKLLQSTFSKPATVVNMAADVTSDSLPKVYVDPDTELKNNEDPNAASPDGPSPPEGPSSEEDEGSSVGGIIAAVLGGMIAIGLIAGFVVHKKNKVSWTDVAVRRGSASDMAAVSTPEVKPGSSYLEMQGKTSSLGTSSPKGLLGPGSSGSPRKSPSVGPLGAPLAGTGAGAPPAEIAL
eukprot:Hpha_TRINITY_DN15176_c0_g3::TRINITY_DN15176_c0_g3_i1::g.127723::m.127723